MYENSYIKYIKADTINMEQENNIVSSNCTVGNFYYLKFNYKERKIYLITKFERILCQIEDTFFDELNLLKNKNFVIKSILCYVVRNIKSKNKYSAYLLVIAYDKKFNLPYTNFTENLADKISNGIFPKFNLDNYEHNQIITTNGKWKPNKNSYNPKTNSNEIIIKSKKNYKDKIIEAAKNKNFGCYVFSIIFIICLALVIAYIVFLLFLKN